MSWRGTEPRPCQLRGSPASPGSADALLVGHRAGAPLRTRSQGPRSLRASLHPTHAFGPQGCPPAGRGYPGRGQMGCTWRAPGTGQTLHPGRPWTQPRGTWTRRALGRGSEAGDPRSPSADRPTRRGPRRGGRLGGVPGGAGVVGSGILGQDGKCLTRTCLGDTVIHSPSPSSLLSTATSQEHTGDR